MNPRLTLTAAAAVILASVSIYPLIQGGTWFWAGVGAVITAAAAGTVTRLPAAQAAVGATALALIAASPLLFNPAWPWKLPGVAVVAAAAASRPRIRILQVLGGLITYVAALLIYLNVAFAARMSVAGIVPTTTSLRHLWSLAGQGLAERASVPPVPGSLGITLLTAGGIGLMAAATDLLAVRLRSPAIAGLPLLALYSVRITTNARQGGAGATVVFCLGMIGYLALLAADGRDRLRIWGRLVTVWQSSIDEPAEAAQAPDTRALAASGRRIGLAAACIALAFPLLIPGVRVHDLFASSATGTGRGRGGGEIWLPDPLVQMNGQLLTTVPQTVLTYHTNAAKPQQQYLQVYVLNYDSDTGSWTLVGPQSGTQVGSGPLHAVPGLARDIREIRTITVVKVSARVAGYRSKLAVLPLPYAPAALQVSGSWQEDDTTLMVYSAGQQLSGLSYTVTSTQPNPDSRELDQEPSYPRSIAGSYESFPAGPHKELARLAARIIKGARTPIEKALRLQNYFTSGKFSYSINVKLPDSIQGLTQFLFHTRQGYCQQFAFAMAALAREVGIPSRIAVGYTAGHSEAHGLWKVTTADAHAWPELYIRDVGWLRFEPTPGGSTGQGTATPPSYAPPRSTGAIAPPPASRTSTGSRPGSGRPGQIVPHNIRGPGSTGGGGSLATRHSIVPQILLAVAIVLGLALVTPMTARWVIRRRRLSLLGRRRDPVKPPRSRPDPGADTEVELAHAAWGELRDNLADFGLASRVSESPRGLARRVAATLGLDPATREALDRIVRAEERARYAAVPLGPGTLLADTATFRRALSREAGWAARWRGWLLPASTLTPIRHALQQSLDVFGWMDVAGLRLRDRIRQQG
jgi:transglutaminase-like putative cysteine protease